MKKKIRLIESYTNMANLMNEDATSGAVLGDVSANTSDGIANKDTYATGDNRVPKGGKLVQKRKLDKSCSCEKECDCGDICTCDGLCTCKKTKEVVGSPL